LYKRQQKQIETGQKIKVGLNKYVIEGDSPIASFNHFPDVKEIALDRITSFKRGRDQAKVEQALDSLKEAASGNSPLMPEFIRAVKVGATLGEITRVLRDTFGGYFQ